MKRAIIIGATSGIGQEVAKNLLREGWQIGIAGRRQPASGAAKALRFLSIAAPPSVAEVEKQAAVGV